MVLYHVDNDIFSIHRSVQLEYNKDITYKDTPGLQFIPSSSFLGNVNKYPENKCYCNGTVKGLTTQSSCLPEGALDISCCIGK